MSLSADRVHAQLEERRLARVRHMARAILPPTVRSGTDLSYVPGFTLTSDRDPLGSGAYGKVWRGRNNSTGALVVIKISSLLGSDGRPSPGNVKVFVSEMVAHNALDASPGRHMVCNSAVACVTTAMVTSNLDGVLVFPFQSSRTLKGFIEGRRGLTQRIHDDNRSTGVAKLLDDMATLFVVKDLLRDVAVLHDAGLAHLDLKPDNVLVTDVLPASPGWPVDSQVRETVLIDLGLACIKVTHPDRTARFLAKQTKLLAEMLDGVRRSGHSPADTAFNQNVEDIRGLIGDSTFMRKAVECKGTSGTFPYYMNPDLFRKTGIDAAQREDMYALGIIVFSMVRRMDIQDDTGLDTIMPHGVFEPETDKDLVDMMRTVQSYVLGEIDHPGAFTPADPVLRDIVAACMRADTIKYTPGVMTDFLTRLGSVIAGLGARVREAVRVPGQQR